MTPATIQLEIERAVPQLLDMAREMAWNPISDRCLFLLTKIPDQPLDAHERRKFFKNQNQAKRPVPLEALVPELHQLYPDLYDINLYIYKSTSRLTVIDIRYYPRTSLTEAYRQQVAAQPPMLHCKVAIPPGNALSAKVEKFDINWERRLLWARWRSFWLRYSAGK
jgi:hypothetical protein